MSALATCSNRGCRASSDRRHPGGLQQWCGINVIFYYAEDVFKAAGYSVSSIMLNIVYTGAIMLVFTFVAICTVDRLGRKPLMLIGNRRDWRCCTP